MMASTALKGIGVVSWQLPRLDLQRRAGDSFAGHTREWLGCLLLALNVPPAENIK